jgi:hypothetical protein
LMGRRMRLSTALGLVRVLLVWPYTGVTMNSLVPMVMKQKAGNNRGARRPARVALPQREAISVALASAVPAASAQRDIRGRSGRRIARQPIRASRRSELRAGFLLLPERPRTACSPPRAASGPPIRRPRPASLLSRLCDQAASTVSPH